MKKLTAIFITMLLVSALVGVQLISRGNANPSIPPPPISTVYIRSDGSIEPSTAPIQRTGNVYSFLSDLPNCTIVVQCDYVVIDGKGFTVSGHGTVSPYTGITLSDRVGVTIKNMGIRQYGYDIKMDNGEQNSIIGNRIESAMDGILMIHSSRNKISGNRISGITYGIEGPCSFNQITANNFTGNTYSIRISGDHNIISDNLFQDQTSVFLTGDHGSHYNIISRNNMSGSANGVYLLASSTNNVVFGNNITGKQNHGIYITECWNNTIYGNHIANNKVGIQIGFDPSLQERYPSINNIFCHNNFVSNVENVRIQRAGDGTLPANHWDNGSQGNYWSDYQGSDANKDGIADESYTINENNIDNYPLMHLFDITIPAPSFPSLTVHLVSPENKTYDVTDVFLTFTVSKPTLWIGYSLDGQENVTITGNTALTDLPNGAHNVRVYAWDDSGNVGASEIVHFTIAAIVPIVPVDPIVPEPQLSPLAMPVEYVNYTIARVNGSLWAKIDGTYPIHRIFGAGDTFELNNITYTVTSDDLPMVYPTPPGTTNIHLQLNMTELDWSNYTETYPEALHYTAIGDWPMIYCMITQAPEYFTLKIHYEHPVEIMNGSYTFLYDLNISPYLTPWSNKSTAFFNIRMETNYENLHAYTTGFNEAWKTFNYSITKENTTETVSVEITSEYGKPLLGDLAVTFTEPKQQGFLGTGLPIEYSYGIVAVILAAVIAIIGYVFPSRRKQPRQHA